MVDVQTHKLPGGWTGSFLSECWKLLKENYILVFVPSFIVTVVALMFAYLGAIGAVIAGVLGVLLLSGQTRIYFALLNGEKKEIPEMFTPLSDPKLFKALAPLIVWKAISGILVALAPGFTSVLLDVIGNLLVLFSNQLITVRGIDFFDTLKLNFDALGKAWLDIIVFGFVILGLAIAGTLALVFPLVLIVMPLISLMWVRIYKEIFHSSSSMNVQITI
ncbi:MAG: hypothetical protein AB7O96_10990 [Pseudobdellovibrionaceae bacterium]